MKMSKAIVCDECFKIIAQKSIFAANIWIALCDGAKKENIQKVSLNHDEILNMLEQQGFIVSLDTQFHYLVKVLGERTDGEMIYICPKGCHD